MLDLMPGGRHIPLHSFLQTSDHLYAQWEGPGDEDRPLDFLKARSFYDEFFLPDDLPAEPKELLLEILRRYTIVAEGGELGAQDNLTR